ncbi:MAG: type II secretion system protein, partial [Clostridia bacterium]|nr:type II secretion system protein [Clostridia bacterium]
GITLIALVITIIVLLILAGVAISMLAGDNGILRQAARAKEQTEQASVEERIQLAVYSALAEKKGEIDYSTLNRELDQLGYTGGDIESLPAEFEINGKHYAIRENGKTIAETWHYVEGSRVEITNGTDILRVGDYVDYNPREGAKKQSYISKDEMSGYTSDQVFNLGSYIYGWRVLGAEFGQILLTSEDFIGPDIGGANSNERTYYCIYGRVGYENSINELNRISELYGQGESASGARSMKVEDINKITGYDPENVNGKKYGKGYIYEYGNKVKYFWDGTNYPYYEGSNKAKGNNKNAAINGFYWYDKGWKSVEKPTEVEDKEYITELTCSYYTYSGSGKLLTSSEEYKMIFTNNSTNSSIKDQNKGKTTGCYYYLANHFFLAHPDSQSFEIGEIYSGDVNTSLVFNRGVTSSGSRGVRPVVYLKSDIKLVQNGENNWSIQ